MANVITVVRVICSAGLLFVPVFSPAFYVLYLTAGLSDMIDGTVARKTGTVSEFGSKLDTAADLVMAAACLIRLIPVLDLPVWLLTWIAVIALIKAINILSGYVMRKEFAAAHTVMNKVTGAALFLFPLTLSIVDLKYSGIVVCALATFAAIQEGHDIRHSKSCFTLKEVSMDKQTEGIVVSVKKQWWLSIRTKALKTGPLDGAVFPHIMKVSYTADGKEYSKREWINAGLPVPQVGSAVRVLYNSVKPSKAKVM